MKNFVSLWSIVTVVFFLNCSDGSTTDKSTLVADNEMELAVDGMVCAVGCAKFIEKEVSGLAGVLDCNVDFESGKAHISFDGSEIDEKKIVSAITDINDGQYQVEIIEQKTIKSTDGSEQQGSVKKGKNNPTKVSFYFPELITYFMHRIVQ